MEIDLIFCASGNKRFAEIAINAGFLYGSQLPPRGLHYPIYFADQNWKKPDRAMYMAQLAKHKPHMATVLDLEQDEQLGEVLGWAEDAAAVVDIVVVIPKSFGIIEHLPRCIGGKEIRLGYSIPTNHGGTDVPVWEFTGWPIHLLGGSPSAQKILTNYLDVRSADGNLMMKMATRYCAFFDPERKTAKGFWPTIEIFDGERWDNDAPYESFRRSCLNIQRFWGRAIT